MSGSHQRAGPARVSRLPFGVVACLTALLVSAVPAWAGDEESPRTLPLTAQMKATIVDRIVTTFDEYYVDVEVAREMGAELRRRHANGDYDEVGTLGELTERLTRELRAITNDLHILILPYEPLPPYRFENRLVGTPEENFGFQKVELLPANIGYLHLTKFYNVREAGPTAVAAMNFLGHCDALIIDLRFNGGGDTTMADLISSYFFDEPQLLNRTYTRKDDLLEETWTQGYVPGPLLADVPIYILLSVHSFSCAESFAYELKHLGRATVVGERTKGGGHAVTYLSYPEAWINIRVPYARDINPVTGTSLQGVGVRPDVPTSFDDAFAVANREALTRLLASETDEARRYRLQWALDEYSAALDPVEVDAAELREYAGEYGERSIILSCGELHYRKPGRALRTLLPMGDDLFTFRSERSYSRYRIQFARNEAGRIVGLYFTGDDDDQPSEMCARTSD
jgi:hypothetical protein